MREGGSYEKDKDGKLTLMHRTRPADETPRGAPPEVKKAAPQPPAKPTSKES